MISFKGTHFPKDVILYAVFFYVRYGVSYRDLEEIMEERGVNVDQLYQNLPINATAIPQLAYACDRTAFRSCGDTKTNEFPYFLFLNKLS
jgi:hypothetical protein